MYNWVSMWVNSHAYSFVHAALQQTRSQMPLKTPGRSPGLNKGALKKICTNSHKKRGGERQCPALCEVCLRPSPGPSSRFQLPRPFERLPLCLFRKVSVVRRLSRVFPSAPSDVEENCLTPQLSSTVVRLVLEEKLSAFPLRAVATFTLFDQVCRACPWFSPFREASGMQSEICACSSVPFPAPSTDISCLQVSAKRPEPLKVSSSLTSSWASSSNSALPQVSSKKVKWEISEMGERGRRASQWIWLIPGSRWTCHKQAWTKSTSPKSTQSQRKRFSCPNGANRRGSGAKTATTTANGAKRRAFASWRRSAPISNSNRMRNICRNGARSEADLAQCGALALPPPPPFFFVAVSTPPSWTYGTELPSRSEAPCFVNSWSAMDFARHILHKALIIIKFKKVQHCVRHPNR